MKKKKLLISALIVGACSVMWACGDNEGKGESDETTTVVVEESSTEQVTEEEKTTEEVESKEPETEEKVDVPVVKKEVFNNGGSVVKYGDDIYYWHYNKDSYVNMGLMGEFSINPTTKNALMCMHKDYSQETIIEAEAVGDIYIINDKLYFLRFIDGYETELCVLSQTDGKWDAASLEVICKGSIHEVDMEKEVCIIEKRNDNGYVTAIYNFTNGQITEVKVENETQVRYVGYYNGNIYVEASAKDAANGVLGEVAIYVADLSGASRLLVRTSADLYDFNDGDSCGIQCIQEYDGYVYYSYGKYAGSAYYYQGGNLSRVKLDGTGNELLATDAAEIFYVYGKDGKTYVLYASSYEDLMSINEKVLDVDTKTVTESDMKLGKLGKVFYGFGNSCWVYEGTDGVCKDLISFSDYEIDDSLDVDVSYVEVVDGYVYYTVTYSKYNPDLTVGWRDGYDRVKSVLYIKELATGSLRRLYEY